MVTTKTTRKTVKKTTKKTPVKTLHGLEITGMKMDLEKYLSREIEESIKKYKEYTTEMESYRKKYHTDMPTKTEPFGNYGNVHKAFYYEGYADALKKVEKIVEKTYKDNY